MADSFLFSIVHYPDTTHGDIKTFDLLLHCAGHYDYEVQQHDDKSLIELICH